jgi:hypothetical protein
VVHVTTGTDAWTVLVAIASLVAAGAACVALVYAKRTVGIAEKTLSDTRVFHREEAAARQAELHARQDQFNAELSLRRAEQIQAVLEIATDLRERAEQIDEYTMQVQHLIPAVGTKLSTGIRGLAALGIAVPAELAQAAEGAEQKTL